MNQSLRATVVEKLEGWKQGEMEDERERKKIQTAKESKEDLNQRGER